MDARTQSEDNLIFKCRTGSHAYGMATPASDLDIRGVFAGAPISMLSPFFPVDQVQGPGDTVIYELSKYVKLVCDQNPNIVELLWVDDSDILFEAPAWKLLRDIRSQLLTTRLRMTYAGYAMQALKKMKSHTKWLNDPQPAEPPHARDFIGMVHNLTLPAEFNASVPRDGDWTAVGYAKDAYMLFEGGRSPWIDASGRIVSVTREDATFVDLKRPAAFVKFARDEYEARKRDHENYWTWKRNRNEARGAIEEKLGYDPKNGAHLIRLMRTAREALREGVVRVRRPDAAELLSIRRGEVPYERVIEMAEEIDAGLASDEASSPLAKSVDVSMVARAVMETYERTWSAAVARAGRPVQKRDLPDPRRRVVVLDVEGSGFATAGAGHIVEVAAVEIMGGYRTGRVFHAYVNPEGPVHYLATKIHGLKNGFLRNKPVFAEIAGPLMAFIGDSAVVAHNARSDMRMIGHDLERSGLPRLDGDQVYCSERMARQMFPGVTLSVDRLCDVLEVDRSARERGHGALIDAVLTADCLLKMSALPGYGNLRRVNVGSRLLDTGHSGTRPGKTRVSLSEDGRTVTFTMPDGVSLSSEVPVHPGTHRPVAHRTGSLLIVRKGEDTENPERNGRPDNPCGPAVVLCRKGAIKTVWFENGKPLEADGEDQTSGPPSP